MAKKPKAIVPVGGDGGPVSPEDAELALADRPALFRRLFRVQDRDAKQRVELKANRCQEKLDRLIRRIQQFNARMTVAARRENPDAAPYEAIRLVIGKCRRGGVSTWIEAIISSYCALFEGIRGLVMAHKGPNAEEVFRYSRQFHAWWPTEELSWRPEIVISQAAKLEFANGSRITTQTSGGASVARGFEFDFYHFSEPAHYDDYSEVNAAILAAPRHAWVFEESTANGIGGGFYQRWQGARELDDLERAFEKRDWKTLEEWRSGGGFIRFFFSWLDDDNYVEFVFEEERASIEASLTKYEQHLVKDHGATLEQIKWRRGKLGTASDENQTGLSDEQWLMQEFPTTADEMFQASGNAIFDGVLMSQMEMRASGWRRAKPPTYLRAHHAATPEQAHPGSANLVIYETPAPGALYVAGADLGTGIGRDDSVMVLGDRTDGTMLREVACLFSNQIPAQHFGELMTMLAELYNNAYLCPEGSNGPGMEACGRIVANRYPHLYHRKQLDRVSDDAAPENSFRFGFNTNGVSKALAVEKTRAALKDGTLELRTPFLMRQMKMYQSKANGSMGAPIGEKDDGVIGVVLMWFGHSSPGAAPPVTNKQLRERAARASAPEADSATRALWASILRAPIAPNRILSLRAQFLGRQPPGR